MSKYGKTVAIDLDGVLATYTGWRGVDHIGQPINGSRGFLRELKREGYHIIIHTARINDLNGKHRISERIIRAWLDGNKMTYDDLHIKPGKPMACAYVDDRAVVCCPMKESPSKAYGEAIIQIALLTAAEALEKRKED